MFAQAIYDNGYKVTFSVEFFESNEDIMRREVELTENGYEAAFEITAELLNSSVSAYSKKFDDCQEGLIFLFNHPARLEELRSLYQNEGVVVQTIIQYLVYVSYIIEQGETDPEGIKCGLAFCYETKPGPELHWCNDCHC